MFKIIVVLVGGVLIYTVLAQLNPEPENHAQPHQRIEFRAFDKWGRALSIEINSDLQSMLQGFPARLYPQGSNQCKEHLVKLSQNKVELAVFAINKDLVNHSVHQIDAFCVESSGLDKNCRDRIVQNRASDTTPVSIMLGIRQAYEQCTQESRITPVLTIFPL
ncbi:hypothetical protein PSI9734_02184 [Pseudidiomarina piscicola]|uniref:Uncharacterized protein n=1 Tax=Pseudidiomarina piscicola TaxID=2614830 RepID=A0A6S6WRD6_9GAMM|nr:hypothetical protein [Pseudidiomarina piscicola]CAB0151824.1 hypothetical protein PSI9734_02184 [Pseudidiomarina piscicola]VZT41270.1 hypothetical protein PSI9734_02184 [Pseudomonas aeruginosa]